MFTRVGGGEARLLRGGFCKNQFNWLQSGVSLSKSFIFSVTLNF